LWYFLRQNANVTLKKKLIQDEKKMNTMRYYNQNRKSVSFFEKWIFGHYWNY